MSLYFIHFDENSIKYNEIMTMYPPREKNHAQIFPYTTIIFCIKKLYIW